MAMDLYFDEREMLVALKKVPRALGPTPAGRAGQLAPLRNDSSSSAQPQPGRPGNGSLFMELADAAEGAGRAVFVRVSKDPEGQVVADDLPKALQVIPPIIFVHSTAE
eukprot:scaffold155805_cov27-Prasinocladus_malaysianus.AAC.1